MHERPYNPRIARRHRGFTLVEMLTVLLILAIILGLVVGISRYLMEEAARKQTEVTQAVLMNAVMRYKTMTGSPPGALSNLVDGSAPEDVRAIALKVPKDQFDGSTAKDGWGAAMTYQPAGGRGGTPVIISNGPDRQSNLGTPTDATNTDNVRSDNY